MEEAEKGEIFERNTKSRLDSHPGAASLLTDDLILEILSRLPARSLHRFKCVSLHWRGLIADPGNRKKLPQTLAGFLYMTVNNSGRGHHFVSVSGDGAAPFDPCLPWLSANKYKDMSQMDACNGLLLYSGRNKEMTTWAEDDCAIRSLGGGWSCPPSRRRRKTDVTVLQECASTRRGQEPGVAWTMGWL